MIHILGGDEVIQILKSLNKIKCATNDKWQRYAKDIVKTYHKLHAWKFHSSSNVLLASIICYLTYGFTLIVKI
jgi:hypothetical protein